MPIGLPRSLLLGAESVVLKLDVVAAADEGCAVDFGVGHIQAPEVVVQQLAEFLHPGLQSPVIPCKSATVDS